MQKRFTISFGTVFSVITVYFIYLYSSDQVGRGWAVLAFVSKWYLIVFISLVLLGLLVFLLISLILFTFFIYAKLSPKKKRDNVYEAKFKVKEKKKFSQ